MDLDDTGFQRGLRAEARELLGTPDPTDVLTTADTQPGYDPALWAQVTERGWPALSFPAEIGGAGGNLDDLAVFAEELGRAACASPFHNGVVQPAMALYALGTDAALAHLRAVLGGSRRYAFCLVEPDRSYLLDRLGATATRADGGWRLIATKSFIPHLDSAEVLLVVAQHDDELALYAVETGPDHLDGIACETFDTIGLDQQGTVGLALRVPDDAHLGSFGPGAAGLRTALAHAAVILSADVVGAARAALDHAVAHVRERQVFGEPVGAYQAVQHRAADMLTDLTMAGDAVRDAAAMIDRGENASYATSVAKALAADAGSRVTAGAHQICGGAGLFADQPLHLWYRRVKSAEPVLGDPRHHRQRVADVVFGAPGAGDGFDGYPARI